MLKIAFLLLVQIARAEEISVSSSPPPSVSSFTATVAASSATQAAGELKLSTASVRPAHEGQFHVALIEDQDVSLHLTLVPALERAVHDENGSMIQDVWTRPCYYSAGDYRYRVPGWSIASGSTMSAAAFETDTEVVLMAPAVPGLLEAFRQKAARPSTFVGQWGVDVASKPVHLSQNMESDGNAVVTAMTRPDKDAGRNYLREGTRAVPPGKENDVAGRYAPGAAGKEYDLSRGASRQWHSTIMTYYRVIWNGTPATVAFIGKPYGSLGRLASAVERERRAGNLIGVARKGVFGGATSERSDQDLLRTLETMGLRFSGVSRDEIENWNEIEEYRVRDSTGVQFLSANLVYSSAPESTLLPDHAIVHLGDLRVAVTALTPQSAASYLPEAGLDYATILDPIQVLPRIAELREQADAVILITAVEEDTQRLRSDAHGVDIVFAEDIATHSLGHRPEARVDQPNRLPFEPPLLTARSYEAALTVVDVDLETYREQSNWSVRERHIDLSDNIRPAAGFPEFDPDRYGISFSTEPPLIPSIRKFMAADSASQARYRIKPYEFWTLAAAMLKENTHSEIAFLPVTWLPVQTPGDTPESVVRLWIKDSEPAEIVMIKGTELKALIARAREQQRREKTGLPLGPPPHFTVAGVGADGKVDGISIEDAAQYRAAISRDLADTLKLKQTRSFVGKTIEQIVVGELRERRLSPPEFYRAWTDGQSVDNSGLWRVNFRDVGLNLQDTKVVRDDAFDAVPNSRIQGFDQFLVGGVFKTDADYLRQVYKWSNTLEMEYARSRLAPRDQPPVINITADRISFLTTETRRAGRVLADWLARSWGPTIGLQAENQFEAPPGLKRRQLYSAYPGVEFYDGTYVQKLELTGNARRDYSRDPANTQYGFHARMLLSHSFASWSEVPLTLQGEFYTNYFFLTHSDLPQDLRLEGEANIKLRVPIRKYLSIAPFIDLYWFGLKTQPLWGYSAMTGVTIGFSRIWKPQYE